MESLEHSLTDDSLDQSPTAQQVSVAATRSPTVFAALRKRRSTRRVQNFLKGKGRLTYSLNPELERSFSSPDTSLLSEDDSPTTEETCKRGCTEILRRLLPVFNDVGRHNAKIHAAHAKSYPNPKKEDTAYRNLTDQNHWIRSNLFDVHGNYLFCFQCIIRNLGIQSERLSRQKKIKVSQCQEPIMRMTKKAVLEQKLFTYVVQSSSVDSSVGVQEWWDRLSDSDEVEVKYPYERHGLAGKTSNYAKTSVKDAFLKFVDANSHPNGWHAGSYSPQFYFIPKFTRIDPPKNGERDYEIKSQSSVVSTFNRIQEEVGEKTCSGFAARQWLSDHRPKLALHPHKSDYCDTCKGLKEEISRQNATFKHLMQAGSTQEEELRSVKAQIEASEVTLKVHKEEAAGGRDYYNTTVQACSTNWETIVKLTGEGNPTSDTLTQLTTAQHTFTLVLSADYQQSKLIPYWGRTEQPGSTYYLQKLSYDIFGIVDHRNDTKSIAIFDETIGPKNTDHTISFLSQYISKVVTEFPWIKRTCIFLDNAGNTNKNRYLFSWGMELVESHLLDHIRFCFLLAGHTKFSPDRLFSLVANDYNREDVFKAEDLCRICSKFSSAYIEDGSNILSWRSALINKYSDLPGVRKLHDFLAVRAGSRIMMKVRESCYKGDVMDSPLRVIDSSVSVLPVTTYSQNRKGIAADKMTHLTQMYSKFVPPDCWPDFISAVLPTPTSLQSLSSHMPRSQTQPSEHHVLLSSSSRERSNPPPAKKPRACSTPGCDGSGHRNKQRWREGHTTRAGCPRIPR